MALKDEWVDEKPGEWVDEQPTQKPSITSDAWKNVKEGVKGIGKFALSALNPGETGLAAQLGTGINKSIREGTEGKDLYNLAEQAITPLVNDIGGVVAPIAAQGLKGIPQAAENVARRPFDYAMDLASIPLPEVKGVGVASKAARIAEEAGKLPERITQLLGKTAQGIGKTGANVSEGIAKREISGWLKARDMDVLHGTHPVASLINEKLAAPTIQSLYKKVVERKNEVGAKYPEILNAPENAVKKISLTPNDTVGHLKEALYKLNKNPETNQVMIERLNKAARDLTAIRDADGKVIGVKNFKDMTPTEVHDFRKQIQQITKWNPETRAGREADRIVNTALKKQRNQVGLVLKKNIPDIADIDKRYSGLVNAESAVKHRAHTLGKSNLIQLSDVAAGGIGEAMSGATNADKIAGGLAGMAVSKVASSTPAKTLFAQGLHQGVTPAMQGAEAIGKGIVDNAPTIGQAATVGAQAGRANDQLQQSIKDDKDAMDWVQKNPNDPMADKIKEVLNRKHNVQF